MIERLKTVTHLPVSEIQIAERLRDVRPEGVATLKEAIQELGFVGRITVRRTKKGDFVLDGAHRLTAMMELGEEEIPCDVLRCSDDEARMFELDGNLAGAKMTALELAYFLARRREMFLKLHPETEAGVAGGLARQGSATDTMSLAKVIAKERGISERHVYRLMGVGKKLDPDEYRRLSRAEKDVQFTDLLVLSKVSETAERYHVVDCLAEGTAKNAAAARKSWKAQQGLAPAPTSPADAAFTKLLDAWDRAPKDARVRFLTERGEAIGEMLTDVGGDHD
ncbi:MAG: chromosome partitioning protein ParB [Rhodobacteraceae bacterium]|nr:chromosome partitioning protein ParB [Paracoccaceae bacterium]